MIERRLGGRRHSDHSPTASIVAPAPARERRRTLRRSLDRGGTSEPPESLLPGRRHRPALLYTALVCCALCNVELERTQNLSSEGRRHFIADYLSHSSSEKACSCPGAAVTFSWLLQAGIE